MVQKMHVQQFHGVVLGLLAAIVCSGAAANAAVAQQARVKCVHVIVALCDNKHQGISPVNAILGNGRDPANNLYWGAMYGVKTFFTRSPRWTRVKTRAPLSGPVAAILERVVFFQKSTQTYMVADAYDGSCMQEALNAFLYPGPGTVELDETVRLPIGRNADLRAFVGHNGLMDVRLPKQHPDLNNRSRPCIVLACASRRFFTPYFASSGLRGVLLTTSLMAPEAYTLEAAVSAWALGAPLSRIRFAAARAYAGYQKISVNAAARLFAGEDEVDQEPFANGQPRRTCRTVGSILCPPGFSRIPLAPGSLAAYTRRLPLKAPDIPVKSWDGRVMRQAREVHGVVDWPAPSRIQQCADVAIRLHAEYLLARRELSRISYRSLSNDWLRYTAWLRGRYYLNRAGTHILYKPTIKTRKNTRAVFEKYLRFVMLYANSASLARDLECIGEDRLLPGNLYIQPDPSGRGGIGHVSVIMDICRNPQGERRYLFGYGFIPAQDFHLPLSGEGAGSRGWFTLKGFKKHVAAFGRGKFHAFP